MDHPPAAAGPEPLPPSPWAPPAPGAVGLVGLSQGAAPAAFAALAALAAPAAPAAATAPRQAPQRASARFMARHPAHWLALGFGSGLSPWAPGTVGSLWGWVSFLVLQAVWPGIAWGWVILAALAAGVWACTRTAQHLGVADPGSIVWDEVVAIWLVLWLWMPVGLWGQLAAFALFRWFDAVKPGPVGWADRLCKLRPGQAIGWRQGAGILFDDLVAAGMTLLVLAIAVRLSALW